MYQNFNSLPQIVFIKINRVYSYYLWLYLDICDYLIFSKHTMYKDKRGRDVWHIIYRLYFLNFFQLRPRHHAHINVIGKMVQLIIAKILYIIYIWGNGNVFRKDARTRPPEVKSENCLLLSPITPKIDPF